VFADPTGRWPRDVLVDGDRLLFGEGSDLTLYSLEDPANPVKTGTRRLGLGPRFDIIGDHAIVGLEWVGVQIMDLTDPTDIRVLDTFDTADRPASIAAVGDLIYVADQEGGFYVLRYVIDESS